MIVINTVVAALIACLQGLGVGGGGLLVIYLTLVQGIQHLNAQGINLIFFLFSALASLFIHFKKRRIDIRVVMIIAISGICTSLAGAFLSHTVSTVLLKKIFGWLLILSGVLALFRNKK